MQHNKTKINAGAIGRKVLGKFGQDTTPMQGDYGDFNMNSDTQHLNADFHNTTILNETEIAEYNQGGTVANSRSRIEEAHAAVETEAGDPAISSAVGGGNRRNSSILAKRTAIKMDQPPSVL
jgi:hypothetical protein